MRKKRQIQSRLKIEGKNNAETGFVYIFSRQEQGKQLHNSMTVAKTY